MKINLNRQIESVLRDLRLSLEHLAVRPSRGYIDWSVAARGLWAAGRVPDVYDPFTILDVIVAEIVRRMRPSEDLPQTVETTDVVFRYDGPVYVRPVGRGVVLSPGRQGGEFLDDVLSRVFSDGDYDMEIIFRAHPVEENSDS